MTSYDPDHAARVIEHIGSHVPPVVVIGVEFTEPIVQRLAEDWRAVGMPVDVRLCRTFADQDRVWRETAGPKACVLGWLSDYPDPDSYLRVAVEEKLPHWKHDRYAALLHKAAQANDAAARLQLYQSAERVLADEAVLVPLVYWKEHLMIKPWIAELPDVPGLGPRLTDIRIGLHEGARWTP